MASEPPEIKPLSRAPINLKMSNDAKVVFDTIGKLAGLTVIYDPDLQQKRISTELNNVTLEQALDITCLQSKTFWKPVTENIIMIIPDQAQKRRDYEEQVVRTFYLSNVSIPQDLTEISTGLRQLLDLKRIQQVNSQNAIIIRDTPDKLLLAEKNHSGYRQGQAGSNRPGANPGSAHGQSEEIWASCRGSRRPFRSIQAIPRARPQQPRRPPPVLRTPRPKSATPFEPERRGLDAAERHRELLAHRQFDKDSPEPGTTRNRWAIGKIEDWRPRASGNGKLSGRGWRGSHEWSRIREPAGQHAVFSTSTSA